MTVTVNYTYDNNGNMISKATETKKPVDLTATGTFNLHKAGTSTEGAIALYQYDGWNQLAAVTAGDKTEKYQYNGEGYRVVKNDNVQITNYLYESDKVILETNSAGTQTAYNVYGINLISRTVGSNNLYYMYNGHADVTALIDNTGAVQASYYYDAFGNILDQTGSVNNNITYAGYVYDEETGLYYLNSRYYDSKIARFLSEDTYTGDPNDPLSLNRYTYCFNNPLIYWDPTGHIVTASDKANLTQTGQDLIQLYTDNYNTYNNAMKKYDKDSVDYYEYKKLRDLQGQKANDVRTSDIFDVHKQTNVVSSNSSSSDSTSNSANISAPTTYTSNQQAQYYLNRMGFDVGSPNKGTPDGVMGVKSSSALIMTQWIAGIQITGDADEYTLKILKYLVEHGFTYEIIDLFAGEKWKPEKPTIDKVNDATKNGHYDPLTDYRFARVPDSKGNDSYLDVNAAVSWSMLVNAAMKYNKTTSSSDDLSISKFAVGEGLRDYDTQVKYWNKYIKGVGNKAAEPKNGYGTSNHGWGVAMDLCTGDPGKDGMWDNKKKKYIYGTGNSTTKEVKWLEKNADSFGFKAYYYDERNKKFRETWHWDYVGKSKANK